MSLGSSAWETLLNASVKLIRALWTPRLIRRGKTLEPSAPVAAFYCLLSPFVVVTGFCHYTETFTTSSRPGYESCAVHRWDFLVCVVIMACCVLAVRAWSWIPWINQCLYSGIYNHHACDALAVSIVYNRTIHRANNKTCSNVLDWVYYKYSMK